MKKVSCLCLALFMSYTGNAQIMGYETPIQMPSMSTYGTNLQMMYLQGLQERVIYNQRLAEVMKPIYDKAYSYYNSNQYTDCIDFISSVFRTYTFYKGQEYLYCNLFYLKGMCYIGLHDMDSGIANLILAKQEGDKYAHKELRNIFDMYYNDAIIEYNQHNYQKSIICINRALSTTLYSAEAYIVGGQAAEALNEFENAKQWYKLAKKQGSRTAIDKLKRLKIKQKEYNKSFK